MQDYQMLSILKMSLQISADAYDEQLMLLLHTAQTRIEQEGATIDLADLGDCYLIIQYAEWLFRTRQEAGNAAAMPRSLRWALNNRIFSEKAAD